MEEDVEIDHMSLMCQQLYIRIMLLAVGLSQINTWLIPEIQRNIHIYTVTESSFAIEVFLTKITKIT